MAKQFVLLISLVWFLFFLNLQFVQADELLIQPNGKIYLLKQKEDILGVSSSNLFSKTILAYTSDVHITVTLAPPQSLSQQIQVEIVNARTSQIITQVVDRIITEDNMGQSISISPSPNPNEYIIQQENIRVYTLLPIQIDIKTGGLYLMLNNKTVTISLSPKKLASIVSGLHILNLSIAKISLVRQNKNVNYLVEGKEKISIFNTIRLVFPMSLLIDTDRGKILEIREHSVAKKIKSLDILLRKIIHISPFNFAAS